MGRFPEKRRVFSLNDMIYLEIPRAVPQNIGLKKGIEKRNTPRKLQNCGLSSHAKSPDLRFRGGTL
jgi:hypothetical protein